MARPPSFTLLIIGSDVAGLEQLRGRLSAARSLTESVDILDAHDIREALAIIADTIVDVVLLDGPGGDDEANAAIRQLRRVAPHVPIVIATDAPHESLAFQAVQAGAQDYVIKELDDGRVVWRAIRHAVERAALGRRRDALLIREHDARLAAEEAREDADRARAKAEQLEHRASFLADASAALSATLDPRARLAAATQLAVPMLAEAAAAFIANDEGMLDLVELRTGGSPAVTSLLTEVRALAAGTTVENLLDTGRRRGCVIFDAATESVREAVAGARAGGSSAKDHMCVLIPLQARDRTLGVLTLILGNRQCQDLVADCALAQAFAARVAAAVDNACLYDASRRATRTRDQVLGIVSHDLRNPLSAIGLCANALRRSELLTADERQHLVSTIHGAVQWTQRLLGDLVDVASLEAGQLSLNPCRVDPIVVLGRTLDLFDHDANGVSLRLAADVPEWLPAIAADEERVLQVLGNLISNARKFTAPGGSITLGAGVTGGAVRFFVSDTGPGIPAHDQGHIFDWYWRATHERTERGTGLGLAIAKGIVEAHSGRIDVESTPGRGTTFSFTIPLARASAAITGSTEPTAARVVVVA